jgi:hypothetical protein
MKVARQELPGMCRETTPSRRERYDWFGPYACKVTSTFGKSPARPLTEIRFQRGEPDSYRSLRDGVVSLHIPGSSCLATFIWSLRDKHISRSSLAKSSCKFTAEVLCWRVTRPVC